MKFFGYHPVWLFCLTICIIYFTKWTILPFCLTICFTYFTKWNIFDTKCLPFDFTHISKWNLFCLLSGLTVGFNNFIKRYNFYNIMFDDFIHKIYKICILYAIMFDIWLYLLYKMKYFGSGIYFLIINVFIPSEQLH